MRSVADSLEASFLVPHPRALGVSKYEGSPYVTSREGRLVITRVLLEGGEQEVSALPAERGSKRPRVYCPFCGELGKYRLPQAAPGSIIPHFAHANDEEACVSTALETIRHRRAKEALVEGLRRLRERREPLRGRVACLRCRELFSRELLPAAGWTDESVELEDSVTGRRPDVVALSSGDRVFFFEVCATHAVDAEKSQAYEVAGTVGVELDTHVLLDDQGEVRWTGSGPFESLRAHWHLERAPRDFSVCPNCRMAPEGLSDFVGLVSALERDLPGLRLEVLHRAAERMGLKPSQVVPIGAEALLWSVERPEFLRGSWGDATAEVIANRKDWPRPNALLAAGFKVKGTFWDDLPLKEVLRNPYAALSQAAANKQPIPKEVLEVADLLARVQGLHLWSERLRAYAGSKLAWGLRDGHTALAIEKLASHLTLKTGSVLSEVTAWLKTVMGDGDLLEGMSNGSAGKVALAAVAAQERQIREAILQRRKKRSTPAVVQDSRQLTEEQREAVANALKYRMSIITGGPGTGKTHVVESILMASRRENPEAQWYLAAPTNKAVQRLRIKTNAFPWRARTIQAWLMRKDFEENPPHGLIIDEASFLDVELTSRVLELARNVNRLVLLGDPDQLPSIGYGAVLRDLLVSEKVPAVRLRQTLRVEKGREALIAAAHAIHKGKLPAEGEGVRIATPGTDIVETVITEFSRRVGEAQDKVEHVQVLAPTKDLVKQLNERIQARFNRKGAPVPCAPWHRVDDRVVCMETVHDRGLINGLQGVVVAGTPESLLVRFEGNEDPTVVSPEDVDKVQAAYAMTVHKAQGSEWQHVIIALGRDSKFCDRNLLYTAATRARRGLTLVGLSEDIYRAVRRVKYRTTLLADLIGPPQDLF